jgi:hypothetical protein
MDEKDSKNQGNSINSNILDKIMGSQTQSSLNDFQPASLVAHFLDQLKERDRLILSKRFGLGGSEIETLEAIGKSNGLTRERVRQIEKDSMNFLRSKKLPELEKALQIIFDLIRDHGSIMSEEFLLQSLQIEKSDLPERQAVKFLLSLGEQFKNLHETPEYYESWFVVGFDLSRLQQVVSEFMSLLEALGHVVSQEELFSQFKQTPFFKEREMELNDRVFKNYLNIAKVIQINPFNEIGLKDWTEVKPRDVGDKAYLVLKHHGKPEHYSAITKMINEHKFDARVAYEETVHNELIKDSRFVLIGRGIYALTEWGYKKGVVADVIREILKSFGRPLSRDEIIAEVLKRRQVKRNTILVGLSNRKNFQKVGKDKYSLAEVTNS